MVDQQQAGAISAAFPAPPPFYKDFTEENLERLAQIQESRSAAQETPSSSSPTPLVYDDLLELPHELRSSLIHLIPPPPPIDTYRSFGQTLTLQAPLAPLPPETSALYTSPPTQQTLLSLTRSLHLNFLQLLHILSTNPEKYGPKWENMRDLFRNAHQAVNEYRPFQAREALIEMLEQQVERGKAEVEGMRKMREKVERVLMGLGEGLENEGDCGDGRREVGKEEKGKKKKVEEEKRVWDFLEEMG